MSGPTAHEKQVADLQTVLAVSRDLAATTELQPLLSKVEQAARSVLNCERATVFLYDADREELYSRMATGVDEIRFSASRGIAGEVIRTGRVINVPDAYADGRFNPEIDRKTGFRTRNLLSFPLIGFDNSTIGVLQVLNKTAGEFDPWDADLVRTFGAQVGVAVQRQMLLEQYAEKQRLQRDLNIARDIQQGLLPTEPPDIDGFDIAGWNTPADETGGDCFSYLSLDRGQLAVILADATGHGIGPALVIAECRALFQAIVSVTDDLATLVTRVNNLLVADLPGDRFVTAFFGLLSPDDGALSYLSAGQGPLFKYTAATGHVDELPAGGPPLGILRDAPYAPPDRWAMQPGDMMVLVTDGFFEWADRTARQFGTERLAKVIVEHDHRPAAEIIQCLHEAVLRFADGTPQVDDLTAVVIRKR
ncbi:MAG: PP2C family protein-serine/threonine phosphatase [Phycisphaerae bacterium]